MPAPTWIVAPLSLTLSLAAGAGIAAQPDDVTGRVDGRLTVDGETLDLTHAHLEEGIGDDMWLVVATAEADAESVFELSGQGGAGIFLALDRTTGEASETWMARVLHAAFPANFGAQLARDALVVEMDTLDGTRAVGRISTPPTEIDGHTLSFDFEVDASYLPIDPCTDLGPVTVDGEQGGPTEAFRSFYEALAACDWKRFEDSLTGEILASWQAEMAGDEQARQQLVDWIVAEIPRRATVVEVRAEDDRRATLVVRFGDQDGPTTEMVVERVGRKRWKVASSELIRI